MNTCLRDDLSANEDLLADEARLRQEGSAGLDAAEARQADWDNIQEIMLYQVEEMDMKNLWRSVQHQRARVAAVRRSVFDAPPGTRPKPGTANRRFFRVQSTLDPEEQRLVDYFGRTESEAEEEAGFSEQLNGGWVPPYEELKAYAEATRQSSEGRGWLRWLWGWLPFGRRTDNGKGRDDATPQGYER